MKNFTPHLTKNTIVVCDEHTLGCISPNTPNMIGIINYSILKGAPWGLSASWVFTSQVKKIRLATPKDFEELRVVIDGYSNDQRYFFNRK